MCCARRNAGAQNGWKSSLTCYVIRRLQTRKVPLGVIFGRYRLPILISPRKLRTKSERRSRSFPQKQIPIKSCREEMAPISSNFQPSPTEYPVHLTLKCARRPGSGEFDRERELNWQNSCVGFSRFGELIVYQGQNFNFVGVWLTQNKWLQKRF